MTTRPRQEAMRQAIDDALASRELTVTKVDIGDLKGNINKVDTKINVLMAGVGVLLTLLLATYGATAFFTWRLIDTIVSAD